MQKAIHKVERLEARLCWKDSKKGRAHLGAAKKAADRAECHNAMDGVAALSYAVEILNQEGDGLAPILGSVRAYLAQQAIAALPPAG